jgi:hypothetical protein
VVSAATTITSRIRTTNRRKGAIIKALSSDGSTYWSCSRELLKTAGATKQKLERVEWPHNQEFLDQVRFKVRMGIIP